MNRILPDDHDLGLQHDLLKIDQQLRQRRQVIGWLLSGSAAAVVAACGGGGSSSGSGATGSSSSSSNSSGSSSSSSSSPGSSAACIAAAAETAGPYPSDGSNSVSGMVSNILATSGVVRSDIRSSFGSSTTIAAGVPLTLTLNLVNSNAACAPLSGYAVYLWHCTRDGNYSLYTVLAENYLRGVQVSNSNGQITFQTIFPGCYSGRYPHIHFEVYPSLALATSYTNRILTSQMALPRDICTAVYNGDTGYSQSVRSLGTITTSSDNVFGDNTAAQIAAQTPSLSGTVSGGYSGTIQIGVAV